RKTSSLVFLDLDEPTPRPSARGGGAPARATPPPVAEASVLEEVTAEPDTSLEIETTSLGDVEETEVESGSLLEGLETTGSDFQDVRRGSVQIPSIREDEEIPDVAPIAELEPTVSEEAESADLGL